MSYGPKIYKKDGGDTMVVEPGGKIVNSVVQQLRTRVTTAAVNAGAVLLPALPGYRYRLVDATLIAIGGNASGATTVDILGTLAAASRKLVAAAVAGLTQSAVARAGAANIAVLANGDSFTVNDANAAITIGVTGAALATATHVDAALSYVIEAE